MNSVEQAHTADYDMRHGNAEEDGTEQCPFCLNHVPHSEMGGRYGRKKEPACDACASVFDAEDGVDSCGAALRDEECAR